MGIGHLLAEAGDHHQHPGTRHTSTEAQQQVAPEPVSGGAGQGQQHAQPQAAQQPKPDLGWRAGEHGIRRTNEVAQVVSGGDQPASRQVELTLCKHVRQLRGKGEAADTHGHHQGHGAGQQLYER